MLGFYLALIDEPSDREKFSEIYASYKNMMFGVAMSVLHNEALASEAVQDCLLKIAEIIGDMTEEQKNTSAESMAKTNGKTLMILAVLTLIYSAVSIVTAFEIFPKAVFVIATVAYSVLFIAVVAASVFRFIKKNAG